MDRPRVVGGLPLLRVSWGIEAGSYLRLIDSCIPQLKAQGPSRTCNESKEEEEAARRLRHTPRVSQVITIFTSNMHQCIHQQASLRHIHAAGVLPLKSTSTNLKNTLNKRIR